MMLQKHLKVSCSALLCWYDPLSRTRRVDQTLSDLAEDLGDAVEKGGSASTKSR